MLSENNIEMRINEIDGKMQSKDHDTPKERSTVISFYSDEIASETEEENLYIHEKKYTKVADKVKVSSRTYFKHRNLIKKIKTNCINLFEKIINTCLKKDPAFFLSNSRNKKKRDVLRYFKCDISKLRNFLLLQIPMKRLITLFSDFTFDESNVIETKKDKLNLLLNMTWKDYLISIKNDIKIITEEMKFLIKINRKDFDIFFNYVLEINYAYDLRPNVDSLYAKSLEKILEYTVKPLNEEIRQANLANYIQSFNQF